MGKASRIKISLEVLLEDIGLFYGITGNACQGYIHRRISNILVRFIGVKTKEEIKQCLIHDQVVQLCLVVEETQLLGLQACTWASQAQKESQDPEQTCNFSIIQCSNSLAEYLFLPGNDLPFTLVHAAAEERECLWPLWRFDYISFSLSGSRLSFKLSNPFPESSGFWTLFYLVFSPDLLRLVSSPLWLTFCLLLHMPHEFAYVHELIRKTYLCTILALTVHVPAQQRNFLLNIYPFPSPTPLIWERASCSLGRLENWSFQPTQRLMSIWWRMWLIPRVCLKLHFLFG